MDLKPKVDIDSAVSEAASRGFTAESLYAVLENLAPQLAQYKEYIEYNQLEYFVPYPWQLEVFSGRGSNGELATYRCLMGGNRIGKTLTGAVETAYHATGLYPDWWKGRRLESPRLIWVGGYDHNKVRDVNQLKLVGPPSEGVTGFGKGLLPKRLIIGSSLKKGVADALETVTVRHAAGHAVTLAFKGYEAGSTAWQSSAVDFVWLDEEPPQDVYSQAIIRVISTNGMVLMTFTPENGATKVVHRMLTEPSPGTYMQQIGWDNAPHLSTQEKETALAELPPHERDMRSRGIPMLGSGAVFPVSETVIAVEPFPLPFHWGRLIGMDFGFDHPTAAVAIAWDRDTDTVYVTDIYRRSRESIGVHSLAIRALGGDRIPVIWPHDGGQHDRNSGMSYAEQYRNMGLRMAAKPFTNPSGDRSVEPGIQHMLDRMQTGKLKVFAHLNDWFKEFRVYHRADGKLVKVNDDLLSATRYAVMSLRYSESPMMAEQMSTSYEKYDPLAEV